jgi:hypothetical protein
MDRWAINIPSDMFNKIWKHNISPNQKIYQKGIFISRGIIFGIRKSFSQNMKQ